MRQKKKTKTCLEKSKKKKKKKKSLRNSVWRLLACAYCYRALSSTFVLHDKKAAPPLNQIRRDMHS